MKPDFAAPSTGMAAYPGYQSQLHFGAEIGFVVAD